MEAPAESSSAVACEAVAVGFSLEDASDSSSTAVDRVVLSEVQRFFQSSRNGIRADTLDMATEQKTW